MPAYVTGRRWDLLACNDAASDLRPLAGDPAFAELLDRLRRGSPELAGWWGRHDVRAAAAGQKVFFLGRRTLRYEHTTFPSNDDPSLKLAIYTLVAGAAGAAIGMSSATPAARAST